MHLFKDWPINPKTESASDISFKLDTTKVEVLLNHEACLELIIVTTVFLVVEIEQTVEIYPMIRCSLVCQIANQNRNLKRFPSP